MTIYHGLATPSLAIPAAFTLNYGSPQARGLVAWWPTLTNEPMRDFSPVGQTIIGSVSAPIEAVPAFNQARHFNGSSTYYELTSNGLTNAALMTVAQWIKIDSDPGGNGWSFSHRTAGQNNRIYLGVGTGPIALIYCGAETSNTSISLGWHHLALTINNPDDLYQFFVDGVLIDSSAYTNFTSLVNFHLGSYITHAAAFFDGYTAETRVYDRPLTAGEVWQLYDPATRWELYQPVPLQTWFVSAAAPVTGNPWYQYMQQAN